MSQNSKNCVEVTGNEFLAVVRYSKIQEYFNSLEFVERKKLNQMMIQKFLK